MTIHDGIYELCVYCVFSNVQTQEFLRYQSNILRKILNNFRSPDFQGIRFLDVCSMGPGCNTMALGWVKTKKLTLDYRPI